MNRPHSNRPHSKGSIRVNRSEAGGTGVAAVRQPKAEEKSRRKEQKKRAEEKSRRRREQDELKAERSKSRPPVYYG
jgi:hypothetical protein